MRALIFLAAMSMAVTAVAQDTGKEKLERLEDIPAPPPAPTVIKSDDAADQEGLEPTVTIKTEGDSKIEEYRIRGRLYMIKVTNKAGPSYYVVDRDGDGEPDTRYSELDPRIFIPKWVITEW